MSIELSALDGANPLAFLATLGVVRLLHGVGNPARLRWVRRDVWRPELSGLDDPKALTAIVLTLSKSELPVAAFAPLGKNITVAPDCFESLVEPAYQRAKEGDRSVADFAASFGSEVMEDDKGRIEYTRLCFITGSGHQHFIGTMAALTEVVTEEHIEDALFGKWGKMKGLSMRWDPSDAAEYAFRWGDPSADGASSVWGANLLAVHALPLFPAHPRTRGLVSTGFREVMPYPEFTWPIWTDAIGLDTVRSLLTLKELHDWENRIDHGSLEARGVAQVYRSPRVRIGQGANFKVSFRPARAV